MPKRFQLSQSVRDHVLQGELNSSGGLSGFHSEAVKSIENGKARLTFEGDNRDRRGAGLTYIAKATVLIGGRWIGPKKSSFFPHPEQRPTTGRYAGQANDAYEKWNEDNLVRWIEQALTSPAKIEAKNAANMPGHERALGAGRGVAGTWAYKAKGVTFYINAPSDDFATLYPFAPGFD